MIRMAVLYVALAAGVLAAPLPADAAEASRPDLIFCCSAENDLYRVVTADGATCRRFDSAVEAVGAASQGTGLLILADGYPEKETAVNQGVFELAAKKKLRLYIEYPSALAGVKLGEVRHPRFERVVVTSDFFGPALKRMQIVMVHDGHFVTAEADDPLLVAAKVAGVNAAIFGLADTKTYPVLFEHPKGNVLVATTKLSHFVTARYMPHDAWAVIWRAILGYLQPGRTVPELKWTPTVRPSYGPTEQLPPDAELQALRRSAAWLQKGRILRHPDWPKEALDWSLTYNTVRAMPSVDWPPGDGSLGMLEGYSSTIHVDGSQPMRYGVRNDCMGEAAMALAFDAAVNANSASAAVAAKLLDYTLATSSLTRGPRADPTAASYGLVGWALDHPGSYWGDDNARALLGVLATSVLLDNRQWDEAVARCLLGNLRTTSTTGYREACIQEKPLEARGWKSYWNGRYVRHSPHYEAWIWACFLQAYNKTGYKPFLERSKTGFKMLIEAYPDRWFWCLRSAQIERARALLPLAWLIRVDDTPEHRRWLRTVASDLLAMQDKCGAIRETLGGTGEGVSSNTQYGSGEATLIQRNGDPICDMLYTCNFALIGLHEAAAATGDPFYAEAEEKLAKFLCRIQIRSDAHPELDGAWYRGFDFRRWEYWASSADWEWGPWCTETGWTQPWIAGTLALRHMKTSLWELTAKSRIAEPIAKHRAVMLPEDALQYNHPNKKKVKESDK